MNQLEKSSEPPEEPHLRSEYNLLSPASPKPVHFPQPTNIPILDMQMDVAFNQTEIHMSDPAMHDTALRPDAWKDPSEQSSGVATEHAPDSAEAAHINNGTNSVDTAPNGDEHANLPIFHGSSLEAEPQSEPVVAPDVSPADPPHHELASKDAQNPNSTAANAPELEAYQNNPFSDLSQSTSAEGGVDVQALLDTLSTPAGPLTAANPAPANDLPVAFTQSPSLAQTQPPVHGAEEPIPPSTSGLGVPPSGLPPRPPPQEQPLIHPNYAHSQHIRDYHPHSSHPTYQPTARTSSTGNAADSSAFVQSIHPSNAQSGVPATGYVFSGQGPNGATAVDASLAKSPLTSSNQFTNTSPAIESRRESKLAAGEQLATEDQPWTADIQRKYDHFLDEERRYVNEARWDQFPQGSRLFVGNLSSEKVTKRDIFHVFHSYGDLAQISIKQAYGFVQFLRAEDCAHAMNGEQGRQIREKKIHLEISKPQKSSRNQGGARRSRSPDHGNRNKPAAGVDRYVSGGSRRERGRDGYRPGYRSPSPRGYRERYDDRYRTRSRSPGYGRDDKFRGQSPRRDEDDELPLPRRSPRDVPDVQIIVLDQLDRDFVSWVEKAFSARSIRVDVLLLSPRLNEEAVVRRQIMEGVVAVSKLKRMNQDMGKIGLTIFKRQGSSRDVQFEEYDKLDPHIAVELVIREKQSQSGPGSYGGYSNPPLPPQQYGYQQSTYSTPGFAAPYAQPPSYGTPQAGAPPVQPANLQSLITNMDPSNLQTLLSTLNQSSSNTTQTSALPPYGGPHSAAYPQATNQPLAGSQLQDPLAALRNNPALMGMMAQQQHNQQQSMTRPPTGANPSLVPPSVAQPALAPSATPNMQDILARLGSYRQ